MTGLDIAFAATGSVTVAAALLAVTTRHLVHAALWQGFCEFQWLPERKWHAEAVLRAF